MPGAIEIDGYDRLRKQIRRAQDSEMPKRMGRAHKDVGRFVIGKLQPRPSPEATGEGAGADVRPSAAKREVLLRVGGAHRTGKAPQMQWGKRAVRPFQRKRPRPDIRGTAETHSREVEQFFLKAITAAMKGAFYDTTP